VAGAVSSFAIHFALLAIAGLVTAHTVERSPDPAPTRLVVQSGPEWKIEVARAEEPQPVPPASDEWVREEVRWDGCDPALEDLPPPTPELAQPKRDPPAEDWAPDTRGDRFADGMASLRPRADTGGGMGAGGGGGGGGRGAGRAGSGGGSGPVVASPAIGDGIGRTRSGTGATARPGGPVGKCPPKVIEGSNPPPAYPRKSRQKDEQGQVVLTVWVDEEGNPVKIEIKTSSGFERLDEAAVDAVGDWRFDPARIGAQAAKGIVDVTIRFVLEDPPTR